MAVLNDAHAAASRAGASTTDLRFLAGYFWRWFGQHKQDKVLKKSSVFGLFTVTILVRDLRPVFVMLFGEEVTQPGV